MNELAVPHTPQTTSWTCGPAALLACFKYLGLEGRSSEHSLGTDMSCTYELGTTAEAMLLCARRRVSHAYLLERISHEQLTGLVADGHLCILLIQAWADPERAHVPYRDDLSDGHYVVATAATYRTLYAMDPSMSRDRGRLSRRELDARWHEADCGRILHRAAIVLEGPHPKLRKLGKTRPIL